MWTALIYKELRETVGIAALAVAAFVVFITAEMGISVLPLLERGRGSVPFLSSDLHFYFACVAVVFTVVLGFRQTAWELWQGTFLFLLHRPVPRGRLVLAKLLLGLSVYLFCSAVPLLGYAVWAATPGTHASPFFWSMTFSIGKLWLAMTVLYVGAFASGLIDGRWLGRRLLPLATAGMATSLVVALPWWWLAGLPLLVFSHVVGVVTILHIARARDYS